MAAIYAAAGAGWIVLSDLVTMLAVHGVTEHGFFDAAIGIAKGLAFVGVTTALLYFVLARSFSKLQRMAAEQEAVLDAAPMLISFVREGVTERVNRGRGVLAGYDPAELVGKPSTFFFVDPAEGERVIAESRATMLRGDVYRGEFRIRRKDGSTGWARSVGRMVVPGDLSRGSVWITDDVTALKDAEERLRASEARYRTLFNANPQPAWVYDLQTLLFLAVNDAAVESYGYTREEFAAMTIRDIRPPEDLHRMEEYVARRRADSRVPTQAAIGRHRRKSGEIMMVEVVSHAFDFEGRRAELVVAGDVTERILAQERLAHLAQHDVLTDLPNRVLLADRLQVALAQSRRSGRRVALLFMDLDRFKNVNDSLGHDAGDTLLKEVAARLQNCVRAADTVSRQSGDEFLVLLAEIDEVQAAARVAEKLVGAISQPFRLGEADMALTISIGIACSPENGEDAESLLRNADAAMYVAKEMGRNRYQFYSAEMNARTHERLVLERDLRGAIAREELFVAYQPQMDLGSRSVAGLEALVRWRHPRLGLVPPGQFIPIAEDCGLIVPLGAWVLETACAQQAAWLREGLVAGPVAVNVSAHQFRQPEFVSMVSAVLARTGLEARYLELELTESVVMQGVDKVLQKLEALDQLGVKLAIDDFGTGYSSLSYLKQFPIWRLKIDQSFTRGLPADHESSAISQAVIGLGHSLGLNVLAEGIETEAQEEHLRAMWCDSGQGYLYARPMPATECSDYLRAQRQAAAPPSYKEA